MQQFVSGRLGQHALSPDGMFRHLESMLRDAAESLADCAAAQTMPEPLRTAVQGLQRRTNVLRSDLQGGVLTLAAEYERETLAGFTRSVMRDMERAGLFDAYRDRCRSLSARLLNPAQRDAALAELDAALTVLARVVGLSRAEPGASNNWIRKPGTWQPELVYER